MIKKAIVNLNDFGLSAGKSTAEINAALYMAAQQSTRSNGVLPITASQTSGNASKQGISKLPAQKLKVVVRRLAPSLTEEEFTTILGDEWKVGQGKVDWFDYKNGKDSKEYVHYYPITRATKVTAIVRQSHLDLHVLTYTLRAKLIF